MTAIWIPTLRSARWYIQIGKYAAGPAAALLPIRMCEAEYQETLDKAAAMLSCCADSAGTSSKPVSDAEAGALAFQFFPDLGIEFFPVDDKTFMPSSGDQIYAIVSFYLKDQLSAVDFYQFD